MLMLMVGTGAVAATTTAVFVVVVANVPGSFVRLSKTLGMSFSKAFEYVSL